MDDAVVGLHVFLRWAPHFVDLGATIATLWASGGGNIVRMIAPCNLQPILLRLTVGVAVRGHTGFWPASWYTETPTGALVVGVPQASTHRAIDSFACFLGGSSAKAQRSVATPSCVNVGGEMAWPTVLADL